MEINQFILLWRREQHFTNESLVELEELVVKYPYFQSARILLLCNYQKNKPEDLDRALMQHVPSISDKRLLYRILHATDFVVEPFELIPWEELRAEAQAEIDDDENKVAEEDADVVPFRLETFDYSTFELKNPFGDGVAHLTPESEPVHLIDRFILETPRLKPISPVADDLPVDLSEQSVSESDDFITETLAKIYMAQGHYEKALKAFEKLSLKFPEKNSYFATQIKEIEKLTNKT